LKNGALAVVKELLPMFALVPVSALIDPLTAAKIYLLPKVVAMLALLSAKPGGECCAKYRDGTGGLDTSFDGVNSTEEGHSSTLTSPQS
jgi:hypothetical protein